MKWTILIILIAYFVAMFIIGLIANRKSKTVTDYYVAGRGLGGVITALVYMSSLVSAGALVGWTGQASSYGVWFIFAGCAVTIATYICWRLLSGKVMRLSKKLDLLTVPDFLEARFESRTARLIAGLILLIFTVPLMVSQFKAAGLLLNMVTGIDYKAAVVLFGVIVFVYVAFGGYFAVVYTDAVQGGLMLFGIAALVITALIAVGGNPEAARVSGIDVNKTRVYVSALLGFTIAIMALVSCGRIASAQTTLGGDTVMDIIAAVVIGGTPMGGGSGTVVGTLFGCLVIGLISNGLNLLKVSSYWQMVSKGVIILVAVILDVYSERIYDRMRNKD